MLKKVLLLCLLSGFCVNYTQLSNLNCQQSIKKSALNVSEELSNKHVVFSYIDVFQDYYDELDLSDKNISFESFCNGYYQFDLSFDEYINLINEDSVDWNSISTSKSIGSETQAIKSTASKLEIISPDADYILKESTKIKHLPTTPASSFKRIPQYNTVDFSSLRDGDIVLEPYSLNGLGHMAIINNTEQSSVYGNYIQTVEAVLSGVQYGFLDTNRMLNYRIQIYRVYRATELGAVNAAKQFVFDQIGKSYSFDFSHTDIDNQDEWYCSELVYAAYYSGGIDILYSPLALDGHTFFPHEDTPFIPTLIQKRFFGGKAFDCSPQFLQIRIKNFERNNWYIEVYNPNVFDLYIDYDSKMCFYNDAKNWSNLNNGDIHTAFINSGNTYTVCISENLFATSIAISYYWIGHRYVTYANKLNRFDYSLNVETNVI